MPDKRRRILIAEFFGRGGLLHYSAQLAGAMVKEVPADVEVVLVAGPEPEVLAPAGVRLTAALATWNPHRRPRGVPPRLLRWWRGWRYVRAWGQLLRIVRRETPALVLLSDLEHRCDGWFVRRLARQCHRRQPPAVLADIWHNVEAFDRYRRHRLQRRQPWRVGMACRFDVAFVHGAALAAQFRALTGRSPCVIPHGNQRWLLEQAGQDPELDARLDLRAPLPLGLLLGALSPYKGIEVLLEALAQVPASARPMILIAGMPTAGVRTEAWRQSAQRLGIADWLRWDLRYIPSPQLAGYFRRADWVVLPYRVASHSGIGHCALTFGKPLVVTATGGLPELIDGNGLIVPPNDAPALAQALRTLAGNAAQRRRWGARSAQLGETRHAWGPIARTVLGATVPGLLLPENAPGSGAAGRQVGVGGGAGIRAQECEHARTPNV